MKTTTRYFIIPGAYTTITSSLLIKSEGDEYWYWGTRSKQWIKDRTLTNSRLMQITDSEAQKILAAAGAPTRLDYRHMNHKFDGVIIG